MKVGVFTVSVPEWDPVETLEILAALGYDGPEWRVCQDPGAPTPGFWRGNRCSLSAQEVIDRAEELKAHAARLTLTMDVLATYIDCRDLAAVELHMKAAAALGAKALRIGPGGYDAARGGFRSLLEQARGQYAQVAAMARRHGVRALVETHMNTLTPSIRLAMDVLAGLDPRDVGIVWDPANEVVEGAEVPRMALEIAGPYLAEVHVKNVRWEPRGEKNGQTQWGTSCCRMWEGMVDWPAVIALLKEFGYDGWLVFEDFSTSVPLRQRIEENIRWIRGLLG